MLNKCFGKYQHFKLAFFCSYSFSFFLFASKWCENFKNNGNTAKMHISTSKLGVQYMCAGQNIQHSGLSNSRKIPIKGLLSIILVSSHFGQFSLRWKCNFDENFGEITIDDFASSRFTQAKNVVKHCHEWILYIAILCKQKSFMFSLSG